jgi:DNA-binding IclR family transcriptional regulator
MSGEPGLWKPMSDTGKTIKSVESTLTILEELRRQRGATLAELSANLEFSKSTVYHHLNTLRRRQYVEVSDDRYHLGVKFLSFGGPARNREKLYRIGERYVDRLADETGETARLITETDGHGLTIYRSTGEKVTDDRTYLGMLEDLHSTAAGKAFLAHLPEPRVEEIVDRRGLRRHTTNTITDQEHLIEQLRTIRERGIAYDDREQFDDVRCVAAPVRTERGDLLGAVSVSAPVERVDDRRFDRDLPDTIENVVGAMEIDTTYAMWNR